VSIRRSVGEHLRRVRETLGWTLREVVKRTEVQGTQISESTLSRLERGDTSVPFEELIAICRVLGTPLALIEEVIRSAQSRTDIDLTGRTFENLLAEGMGFAQKGAIQRALACFEAAHDLLLLEGAAERRADRLAEVLIHRAEAHRRLRQFNLSLDLAGRVLNLSGCSEDQKVRAMVLHVTIHAARRDFFQARLFAERLLPLRGALRDEVRAYALEALGALEYLEGRYSQAIPLLEESCALLKRLDRPFQLTKTMIVLGACIGVSGSARRGEAMILEAIDSAGRRHFPEIVAYGRRLLAWVSSELGRYDDARGQLEKALDAARPVRRANEMFRIWYELWRLEEAAQNPDGQARAERVLQRLVHRADPDLPAARKYLAAKNGRLRQP